MAGDKRATLDLGAWLCWEDEAGQNLRPPKATTWAPRGRTPVVAVTGKGHGRVCLAGLVCAKPGQRTRLMYRMLLRRGRPGEVKGFSPWRFAALLDAAHRQLGGPIVLVWDNDRRHLSRVMRAMIEARPWLTVFQLPSYAPELNPAEGVWSALKRALANLAPRSIDELAAIAVRHTASGRSQGTFIVELTRTTTIAVYNCGWGGVPRFGRLFGIDAEHGRGLAIVAALADRFGYDGDEEVGHRVWARMVQPGAC